MDKLRVQSTGFPATTETWKFIVEAYESIHDALAQIITTGKDPVIIAGAEYDEENQSYAPGLILLKGEILPFVGGPCNRNTDFIHVIENITSVQYDVNGDFTPFETYFKRWLECTQTEDETSFQVYKRIENLLSLTEKTGPADIDKAGIIQIATSDEVAAAQDNTKAVTPATLQAGLGQQKKGKLTATYTDVAGGSNAVVTFTISGLSDPFLVFYSATVTPEDHVVDMVLTRIIGRTETEVTIQVEAHIIGSTDETYDGGVFLDYLVLNG